MKIINSEDIKMPSIFPRQYIGLEREINWKSIYLEGIENVEHGVLIYFGDFSSKIYYINFMT